MMSNDINERQSGHKITSHDVQQVVQRGDFEKAVGLAKEVLESNPKDVYCLSIVAQSAFGSGNLDEAKGYLITALEQQPGELNLNRSLGLIQNKQGEFKESVNAFIQGIENNAKHPGMLLDVMLMGISLDKISPELSARVIEMVFNLSTSLRNAYMNKGEVPLISDASNIANSIIRDSKYKIQKEALEELSMGFSVDEKQRLYDFLDIFHGMKAPVYTDAMQRPTYHAFPGLEVKPFYDSVDFDWVNDLESEYQKIKQELLSLYNEKNSVKPYIDGVKTGVEGLDLLADSLDWSSIHLIKGGKYNHDLLAKCHLTNEILTKLPIPVIEGNAPEVFLSVLKPGAEIKPHFGLSNIKLTVHLGLEIPSDCAIRVGDETQTWENGKVLIFDDTFEHEAWNRSSDERKVLILEIWHPDLTLLEIQGIQKMMELQHKVSELAVSDSIDSLLLEIKNKI